jgi:chromosomal replication initiator protein
VRAGDGEEVTTDDMEIVSVLRNALADKVGKERFELWFGASTRLELADDRLIVGAPNRFFTDWLRLNFRRDIEAACLDALGTCPTLEFCVDATLPEPKVASTASGGAGGGRPAVRGGAAVAATHPDRGPTPADRPDAGGRRRLLDLESFVTGPSNRLATAAAEMVAQRPGELSPLLFHGPTGVGKTHLLEGICSAARKARPGVAALYLSAEQFTSGFLQALRGSGLPSFRQKYRGVELLVIDDLQFFCGKRYTQLELLYTIDTLSRDGRQTVFAADRPPVELDGLGAELCARLEGGMVCRIDPPEYDTRLGIVGQMVRRMGLRVPEAVRQFIAARLNSHARELSGALCRLEATSRAIRRPIDLTMAEEALAEMIRDGSRAVRLTDIEKAVCETFGLEPSSLQSGRKAKRVSHPRMLAMWLARKYTRAALSEIGHYFGRRSHSTVISAQKRVDGWLAGGASLEIADGTWKADEAVRKLEQRLRAG